jgi:F-type H+-transporting ATPase subunit b
MIGASLFDLDATLAVGLVMFVLVAVVVAKAVVPPVRRRTTERQGEIEAGLETAQQGQRRLAEAERHYQERIAAARREGRGILDTSRDIARFLEAEGRRRGEEEYGRLVAKAHAELERRGRAAPTDDNGTAAD